MLTSSMLPTETKYENPMPSSNAQSSTEVQSAPDCEMKPMCPLAGVAAAKLAFRLMPGTMMPRQFGPENPHAVELPLLLADELFELPAFRADLAEPGRDDHHPPRARLSALPHQRGHGGGGRADHGQVGGVRQARDVLVRLDPLNGLALRVDRIDHAPKARADQIPQHRVSDARRRIAGANDGNAMGLKNLVQVPNTHDLVLIDSYFGKSVMP